MLPHKFFPVLVLCVLVLCPAFAQDSGEGDYAGDYFDLGESGGLVVTADRIREFAEGIPGLVTVITAEDIAASGAAGITEILEKVPGVRFSGAMSGAGSETVSMRGFGENSFGRVLILVDGNKINDPDMKAVNWNSIPLSYIERIEIMDGSASVQYGSNAVGGVINIITKADGERRTSIGASGGSFFYNRESIFHFEPFPLGSFSFAAEHTGTEGYRERQGSRAANVAAGAEFFLGDSFALSLDASFADFYYRLPGALTREQFEDDPTKALYDDYSLYPLHNYVPNFGDENTERHFGGSLAFQWFPGENFGFNLPLSYKGKMINMDMDSWRTFTDRTVHSVEARPQAHLSFNPAGMPLRFLAGIDLYYVSLGAGSFTEKNRANETNSFSISEWTAGPFLRAGFSPLSVLNITAGARFDTAVIDAQKSAADIDESKNYSAFVYEGMVEFNPARTIRLYAKYSSLFRYPFVDELAQVSGMSDKFNFGLESEKGFNAEAGVSCYFGEILGVDANFFYMNLEDEIAVAFLDPANPYDATNVNLNRTRRLGVNAGFDFTPLEFFSLEGSYSFVNAVFADGENEGKNVPLVPSHELYAAAAIKLPFGLDFGPTVDYSSGCFYGEDYSNAGDMMGSRFLMGAQAGFSWLKEGREFIVRLRVKNLTDHRYASYGTYSYGSYTLYPADGRSVNISVNYRF